MRFAWSPVLLLACGPPSDGPAPDVGETDPPVSGDTASLPSGGPYGEGQIVLRVRRPGGELGEDRVLAGLFADDLQGQRFAPLCAILGELCLTDLPEEGVGPVAAAPFDVDAAAFAWVGDAIGVGGVQVPFFYQPRTGLAGYLRRPKSTPDGPVGVSLGGEWGGFSAPGLLALPDPLEISPDPLYFLNLSPTGPTRLSWPPSSDPTWVVVTLPDGTRQVHRAGDDAFSWDARSLLPLDEGETVTLHVLRARIAQADVNGHALQAIGLRTVRIEAGTALPASCRAWLTQDPSATTGLYLIQPFPREPAVPVWCDMDTDGGGWTLVSASDHPVNDQAAPWSPLLTSLDADGAMAGVWDGLRHLGTGRGDLRFTCRLQPDDEEMFVDLSFYDVGWYREITTGTDADSCFSEDDGRGADHPPPARRNNRIDVFLPAGTPWNAGYLEGEDACDDEGDFTVDFLDRGMDSNQSDGTDWGKDDHAPKCGLSGRGAAWFLFFRER